MWICWTSSLSKWLTIHNYIFTISLHDGWKISPMAKNNIRPLLVFSVSPIVNEIYFKYQWLHYFLTRICSFYIIQCIKQNGNGKIDTCINHKEYLWYICRYIVLSLMVSKYLLLVNLLENQPLVNKIYLDIWPNLSF